MKRPVSYAPIVLAAGAMLALSGAVSTWILSAVGLLVMGIGAARWLKEVRNEK
jgi:uncharacterized membrane protein